MAHLRADLSAERRARLLVVEACDGDLLNERIAHEATRAQVARLRAVLVEHDRKLKEIWGKEDDPYACALGWVRIHWDAALASTPTPDASCAMRIAEAVQRHAIDAAQRACCRCSYVPCRHDDQRVWSARQVRDLDLRAIIAEVKP